MSKEAFNDNNHLFCFLTKQKNQNEDKNNKNRGILVKDVKQLLPKLILQREINIYFKQILNSL